MHGITTENFQLGGGGSRALRRVHFEEGWISSIHEKLIKLSLASIKPNHILLEKIKFN